VAGTKPPRVGPPTLENVSNGAVTLSSSRLVSCCALTNRRPSSGCTLVVMRAGSYGLKCQFSLAEWYLLVEESGNSARLVISNSQPSQVDELCSCCALTNRRPSRRAPGSPLVVIRTRSLWPEVPVELGRVVTAAQGSGSSAS
jgi:hypothetical protein